MPSNVAASESSFLLVRLGQGVSNTSSTGNAVAKWPIDEPEAALTWHIVTMSPYV